VKKLLKMFPTKGWTLGGLKKLILKIGSTFARKESRTLRNFGSESRWIGIILIGE